MIRQHLFGAALLLTLAATPHAAQPPDAARPAPAAVLKPLGFEPNRGQANARAEFIARGAAYTVALSSSDAALSLGPAGATVRFVFVGAADSKGQPLDQLNEHVHYGTAQSPQQVPVFGRVRYPDTYPGIDVVYYGHHGELEFDLDVAAGADPSRVRLHVEGADAVRVDTEGALRVGAAGREIRLDPPIIYQSNGGSRVPVATHYVLGRDNDVTITIGPYEPARRITI